MKTEDRTIDLKDQRRTVQMIAELFDLVQACIGGFEAISRAMDEGDLEKAREFASGGGGMISRELGEIVEKYTTPVTKEQVEAMKDMEIFPEKMKGTGTVH